MSEKSARVSPPVYPPTRCTLENCTINRVGGPPHRHIRRGISDEIEVESPPVSDVSLSDGLIEAAARAYYEWATVNAEPSLWYEDSPSGEQARRFARNRAEIILSAALAVTDGEGNRLLYTADELAAKSDPSTPREAWEEKAIAKMIEAMSESPEARWAGIAGNDVALGALADAAFDALRLELEGDTGFTSSADPRPVRLLFSLGILSSGTEGE